MATEIRYWRAGRINQPLGPGQGMDTRLGFGILVGKRKQSRWIELTEDEALEAAQNLVEAVRFNRRLRSAVSPTGSEEVNGNG